MANAQQLPFEIREIDRMFINEAIQEMNEHTENGYKTFYSHIGELQNYTDAIMDFLKKQQISQDVIDQMTSSRPQLAQPKLPRMLPVEENRSSAVNKRKKGAQKTDQELMDEMEAAITGDPLDAPVIQTPMSQVTYELPTLQHVLVTAAVALSDVDRLQLNNIYNFGQWLLLARESFNTAKKTRKIVFCSHVFGDWTEQKCKVKKTKAYDYMSFVERFAPFPKVLKCKLPFEWFRINGRRVSAYLQANTRYHGFENRSVDLLDLYHGSGVGCEIIFF